MEPTDIYAAIADAMQRQLDQARADHAARQQAHEQAVAECISTFRARCATFVPPHVFAALGMQVMTDYVEDLHIVWRDSEPHTDIQMLARVDRSHAGGVFWHLVCLVDGTRFSDRTVAIQSDATELIIEMMAAARIECKRAAKRAAAKAAEDERNRAEFQVLAARGQEQVDAILANHPVWTWPDGASLSVFHWSWCVAPAVSRDSDDAVFHSGWSLQAKLSENGWLKLEAERYGKPRTIRLTTDVHMPVVEKYTFHSLADLLDCDAAKYPLTESERITVPGVVEDYRYGQRAYLPSDADVTYISRENVPLPWLREALAAS